MKKLIDKRPWGNFIEFTHNESTTVKILTITPHQELSLQYHNHRKEFWRVLKGHPRLIVGDKTMEGNPGDEFEIPEGFQHQIFGVDDEVEILEISFGDFDENDIVRLKDKYGRV